MVADLINQSNHPNKFYEACSLLQGKYDKPTFANFMELNKQYAACKYDQNYPAHKWIETLEVFRKKALEISTPEKAERHTSYERLQDKVFFEISDSYVGCTSTDAHEQELIEWSRHYVREDHTGKYSGTTEDLHKFEAWISKTYQELSHTIPPRKTDIPVHWIPQLNGIPIGFHFQGTTTSNAIVHFRQQAMRLFWQPMRHQVLQKPNRGYLRLRGAQDKNAITIACRRPSPPAGIRADAISSPSRP
eukprot:CAMPEP_0185692230 /NCGR_PEP_ID=MMETSP1164-20130828/2386_1 /TAXON_ID=1104430 /ORGANISM="Chrysoreinhardia sp, Strain CCMP2950" /LENGTH=246 /DNA_ID=CAMNT_0028358949 /DNA_START=1352 /DNA_END=2088 /DNA_ORIENTATION=+